MDKAILSAYTKISPSSGAVRAALLEVFLGKTAPAGLESNWIPTGGLGFFPMFRFYGPEEAYFNKTFKLNDIERL